MVAPFQRAYGHDCTYIAHPGVCRAEDDEFTMERRRLIKALAAQIADLASPYLNMPHEDDFTYDC